ncbi:MAG: acyl-CoA dehydrogenase C-terminal domain-containing protein [Pseudomonadota bacterium]
MHAHLPPLREYRFVLHEVLAIHTHAEIAGYADLSQDTTEAVLSEAERIAAEVLQPLNAVGDRQGCRLENGVVYTPEGFRRAYDLFREGGWSGLEADPEWGGQGMPAALGLSVGTLKSAANMGLMMYHGLSSGAYRTLAAHGSEAQKRTYLPPLASGAWMGTMNLTEPQCGTDLGLVKTRAEPAPDGSYRITGQKIWISAGEHDLAENIVHLVLARTPEAPAGTKGLSLFVVPKFLVDEEGRLGARNALACTGLERKMGIHSSATCAMSYDGATGWLVGEEGRGLAQMFTMMNHARLLVGMQGLAVAQAAHAQASAHAHERLQGRAVDGVANPDGPADPLVVHADVRRMLLEQKAFTEGGLAFLTWVATLLDAEARHEDPEERKRAGALLALLTPVAKGYLTEEGFRTTVLAQQVLGGAGYVADVGLEQLARDVRITTVYEGTTGIQALDLVGRKLGAGGGAAVRAFFATVKEEVADDAGDPWLRDHMLTPLQAAAKDLEKATLFFASHGLKNPNAALAGATDFLHLFGLVCMGVSWARMARTATKALATGTEEAPYYAAKRATARFFAARMLPETQLRLVRIETGAEPVMEPAAAAL